MLRLGIRGIVLPAPMKWRVTVWMIAFTSVIGSVAHAQPERADERDENTQISDELKAGRALARELGQQGVAAYKRGDFAAAAENLAQAFGILHAPTLALWWARTLRRQSKFLRAAEIYLEAMRAEPTVGKEDIQLRAQALAARERLELLAAIPKVTFDFDGAPEQDLVVEVDGTHVANSALAAPLQLDPGKHRIVARSSSRQGAVDLEILPGTQLVVPLHLKAIPKPVPTPTAHGAVERARTNATGSSTHPLHTRGLPVPRDGWTTTRWLSFGVGGTALVFSGVVSLLALPKLRALEQRCTDYACGSRDQELLDEYRTIRLLARIGFIVGTIGVATSGYLYVVAPNARQPIRGGVTTNVRIGAGAVGIDGVF